MSPVRCYFSVLRGVSLFIRYINTRFLYPLDVVSNRFQCDLFNVHDVVLIMYALWWRMYGLRNG